MNSRPQGRAAAGRRQGQIHIENARPFGYNDDMMMAKRRKAFRRAV